MAQADKRLEEMRSNPRGNWTIADVGVVCSGFGIELRPPKGGSHYKITHASQRDILTIPHRRPTRHRALEAPLHIAGKLAWQSQLSLD